MTFHLHEYGLQASANIYIAKPAVSFEDIRQIMFPEDCNPQQNFAVEKYHCVARITSRVYKNGGDFLPLYTSAAKSFP